MMRRETIFTVEDAEVKLWKSEALNESPLFMGTADTIRLGEKFRIKDTRPSGAAHRNRHHVDSEHELTFGRVWTINQQANPDEDPPEESEQTDLVGVDSPMIMGQLYVLQVTWKDKEHGSDERWYRRVYHGVTWDERTLDGEIEFKENSVLGAQYYTSANGLGTPP